ncbi:MAG: FAD-binding oxidoreductase [Puniceicoccales bacterium]|jgi:glycine/D-amino acid oxidase-like deaminating enzyme|nr:FAD-binding oxidoreductase [Puniceicoccales bacterium]
MENSPHAIISPEKEVDFLIIGQGVAGTFLARALLERGRRIIVIDDAQRSSASRVAAGLLNPVTGMRLHLTKGTSEFLACAKSLFSRLEREHGQTLFTPIPVRRIYVSVKERELKVLRAAKPDYATLMSADDAPGSVNAALHGNTLDDAHGSFLIHGGGWVDLPRLLDLEHAWLRQHSAITEGAVQLEELRHDGSGGVLWNGWCARYGAVFCNGYKAGITPCWDWIPWRPARGEIVDCESTVADAPWMLNRNGWAVPLGNGHWRSGSTWEWNATRFDDAPSPALAEQLRKRLQGFFKTPVDARLVSQRTGVRPCVLDNQPFCGTHPQLPWLHLFGGFGPKGVFWGPSCSNDMAAWLCEGKPLPARFDLRRAWHGK